MKRILILAAMLLCISLLLACGGSDTPSDDDGENDGGADLLSGITLSDVTAIYDGRPHSASVDGDLGDGITVEYEPESITDPGTVTVRARFYQNGVYIEGGDMTATLTVLEHPIEGARIQSGSFSYNGSDMTPAVSGIPDTVRVDYLITDERGEICSDATTPGRYSITAALTDTTGAQTDLPPLYSDIVITKGVYDLSGISFENARLPADGEPKSIFLRGELPEGVTVSYEGNGAIFIGKYEITATLTFPDLENYEIPERTSYTAVITVYTPDDASDGLTYTLLENRTYAVTGYTGSRKYVTVPATYEGRSVSTIGTSAFEGHDELVFVDISAKVTRISARAFKDCSSLSIVDFNNTLNYIGAEAFRGTALTDFAAGERLDYIGNGAFRDTPMRSITLGFIGSSADSASPYLSYIFGATSYAAQGFVPKTLESVTLTDACVSIPAFAFYGLDMIKSIFISRGAESIGNCAFSGCTSLESIFIPATVTDIPANAYAYNSPFYMCSDELIIYLAASDDSAFGKYWCHIGNDQEATVILGAQRQ